MSLARIHGVRVAGVTTCVPPRCIDNNDYGETYGATEVRKVVAMAGVRSRHVVEPGVTSADLCFEAAADLMTRLGWAPESVTGLILVTQSPDYFLPSSSCMVHKWLGLSDRCAAFDLGLGCSGYPYGLYLASTMLHAGGQQRILLLHGDTPSVFVTPDDYATTLLFSDAGSATAIETSPEAGPSWFCLQSDGKGYDGLIIRGGGFRDRHPANPRHLSLEMDGAAVFQFTIQRVPPLVRDTLEYAGLQPNDIDWYAFHQSNRFMMQHLIRKCGLPEGRVPLVLDRFGNCGGPSVPLAMTQGFPADRGAGRVMMLGYGVGLSWASAIVDLGADVPLTHVHYTGNTPRA